MRKTVNNEAPLQTTDPEDKSRTSIVLARKTPEWITAISGIGMLLVGLASFWTTVRVSGLEDYFQSELAIRNQELVSASKQLNELQERAEVLNADIERTTAAVNAASQERSALSLEVGRLKQQGRTLLTQNAALSAESTALQKAAALRDFSSRLVLARFEFGYQEMAGNNDTDSENPGLNLLQWLQRGYDPQPSDNQYTRAIFAALTDRCSGAADTPIMVGPYTNKPPPPWDSSQAPSGAQSVDPQSRLNERVREIEIDWGTRTDQIRLYYEERRRRSKARLDAHEKASDALLYCAAEIIGAK